MLFFTYLTIKMVSDNTGHLFCRYLSQFKKVPLMVICLVFASTLEVNKLSTLTIEAMRVILKKHPMVFLPSQL